MKDNTNIIFPTNFYVHFQVPNAKEIIETVNCYDESYIDNSKPFNS